MRFRYSFQKIVDLKNNERTQAEWILSDAIVHLRNEETHLSTLSDSKNEILTELATQSKSRTTISQMMLLQSYSDHLEQQIVKKYEDIQVAQNVVVHKRERLSEKMLDEKVWSKAREKAFHKYRALVGKKEQETLDEMATNRYKRRS
ncbi:flagellar biosynthesis chaperone [compost metagenome]